MDHDEIVRRAKIRHEHVLAKRERAEALERAVRSLQADLRILASEILGKIDEFGGRLRELAGRLAAQQRELDQEETTISLPALEPKNPRTATTQRVQRPDRAGG